MSRAITILLVDDDPDCRTLARDAITYAFPSARVWEVCGGCDALDFLRRRGRYITAPVPDIVYTDLEMPDMSGQDLLKALKNDPALRDMPVVVLTGLDDDRQRLKAQRNGARSYALKCPGHRELRITMAQTIREILGVGPSRSPMPARDGGKAIP